MSEQAVTDGQVNVLRRTYPHGSSFFITQFCPSEKVDLMRKGLAPVAFLLDMDSFFSYIQPSPKRIFIIQEDASSDKSVMVSQQDSSVGDPGNYTLRRERRNMG
jgi:hypothetical protein